VPEVFAGFLCGYVLALISTPLLAVGLLRLRGESALLGRLLPPGVSAVGLSVLLHTALFFTCTAIGIVLGLLLLAMKGGPGALGSANTPFTLFVAGLTLAVIAPVAIVVRPLRASALGGGLVVLIVFGWLMPYLAQV